MELVLATQKLTDPGGAPTYALTLAEQLARLGHSVTLYARELGVMAEQAKGRALRVTGVPGALPAEVDGVISGVDAVVLATMRRPQDQLVRELDGSVEQLFAIGDALARRCPACGGPCEVKVLCPQHE